MKQIFLLFTAAVVVASCAGYTLVKPARVAVNDLFSVESQIEWNKWVKGKNEYWTVDGPSLQALIFINGVAKGERLFSDDPGRDPGKRKIPEYDPAMTAIEISEFFEASMTQEGASNLEILDLRPANFGALDGFRFDLKFSSSSGLEYVGFALGTRRDEKLYMIFYRGTRLEFFDKHKDDVERLISSLEIKA